LKYPPDAPPLARFNLTHVVKPAKLIKDMKALFGLANGIEDIENPYHAANKALKYTKRFGVSNLLCEFEADVQKDTLLDRRFKGLEYSVAIAIEKAPKVSVQCCTPGCKGTAIANSHTLQKGGVLRYLSSGLGKVYQTKLTPFTKGDALYELSIRSATTFPGYCASCETSKFAASENAGVLLSTELIVPLIWRALCFIRFRRAQEVKARGLMISKPEMFNVAREYDDPVTGLSQALAFKNSLYSYRAAKKWTEVFDRTLDRSNQPFTIIAIEVPDLPFAGTGLIPIPIAFDGSTDPNLFKFYKEISSLSYSTVLIKNVPYLVLAFRKTDGRAKSFCKEMMSMNPTLLSAYLPQIIIGGSDTVYISKEFWDNQASATDKLIIKQAQAMKFPEMSFPQWGRLSQVTVGKRSFLN
jgi:hypothetical protein